MKTFFAAALLSYGIVGAALAADEVKFQLAWLPGGEKAAVYVCIERGFCEAAGLDVTIESGRGSSEALTKLATGISDIGNVDLGSLMAARAVDNLPATAVMSYYNKGPHAFFTLEDSGIETVADLAGKTIATSPFTSSNLYLPRVLRDNGISIDDVELIKTDPGALNPMMITGRTDAIISWMTDVSRYRQQTEDAGRAMNVLPWSEAGLEIYSDTIVASDRFLEERPDVARRFVSALLDSMRYMRENPEDGAQAVADAVPELDAETALGSLNDVLGLMFNEISETDGLGHFEAERLRETWERVAEAQEIDPSSLSPEDVIDDGFLPAN